MTSPGSGPDPEVVELAHRLLDAARSGDSALLGEFLDAGAPVDLVDPQGNSLLMLAAYHGHAAMVGELAERGADVDRVNDRARTPLAAAVSQGELEVLETLLAAGADPDLGAPSARETARILERDDLGALLGGAGHRTTSTKPDTSQ